MTAINWANASQNAQSKFDTKIQDAAEGITLGIDDLVDDSAVPRSVKLQVLEQLALTLGDRNRLQALLTGQAPSAQTALGGNAPISQPAPAGPTAEQTRIKKLEDGYNDLANELGMSVTLSTGGGIDIDAFRANAKRTVDDKVNKAKAAAPAANSVDKAKVKTEVDKAKAALAKIRKSSMPGSTDQVLTDADAKAVKSAIDELAKLAS